MAGYLTDFDATLAQWQREHGIDPFTSGVDLVSQERHDTIMATGAYYAPSNLPSGSPSQLATQPAAIAPLNQSLNQQRLQQVVSNSGTSYQASVLPVSADFSTSGRQHMTREGCIAAIQHQMPIDISQQFSCASQGYHGNSAWPIPQPTSKLLAQQTAQAIANPMPISIPTIPQRPEDLLNVSAIGPLQNSEIVPPPPMASGCESFSSWISENKLLAIGLLAGLWLMKGKS